MLRNRAFAAGLVALFLSNANVSASEGYRYYYFDQPLQLEPEPGIVGILGPDDEVSSTTREFLKAAGLDVAQNRTLSGHHLTAWNVRPDNSQTGFVSPDQLISHLEAQADSDRYFFTPVFRAPLGGYVIPRLSILVQVKEEAMPGALGLLLALASETGGSVDELPYLPNMYRVTPRESTGLDVLDAANSLAQDERIRAAVPNFRFTAGGDLIPNDEHFDISWGRHNTGQSGGTVDMDIDAPEAWNIETGNASVVVAVLDVGVDQDHPDLNQIPGADVTNQGPGDGGPVNVCDHHGTLVAGMVSSVINNSIGTAGAAPDSVITSIRLFQSTNIEISKCSKNWIGDVNWFLDALDTAQSMGAQVTVNSFSFGNPDPMIDQKYQQLRDQGIIHFASAGNAFVRSINYPARIQGVNAITGIYRNGAHYGNYGPEASMAGPAVDVVTTDIVGSDGQVSGDYGISTGTSYATPLAGAVAALLRSRASNLTSREVELFMESSTRDLGPIGWDEKFGWGLFNARNALGLIDIFTDDLETGNTSRWDSVIP